MKNINPNSIAVIFDMDGTMLDSEPISEKAWEMALAEWGRSLQKETYLQIVGRTMVDALEILQSNLGAEIPIQEVYARRQYYVEHHVAKNGIPIKPGLKNLLAFLKEHNIPRAVASSTYRASVEHKLQLTGIYGEFSTIICGDEVVHGKPAPDIFLEAARLLQVKPKNCFVMEDSEAGIEAAHAAGMFPIMIPDMKQPGKNAQKLAYKILPSLNEAISLLQTKLS